MRTRLIRQLAICALGAATTVGTAMAATRAVGDKFVYTMKTVIDLPAGTITMMPSEGLGRFAMANGTILTLTLKVVALNPDGSAHAKGTAIQTLPSGASPMDIRAVAIRSTDLEATIGADGTIVPKYDAPDYSNCGENDPAHSAAAAKEFEANYAAGLVIKQLDNFDEFVLGCATRASFNSGEVWRLNRKDSPTWTFTVTGARQIAGHDVETITMTTTSRQAPNSTTISKVTGDYDPARQVVVRYHEEAQMTNLMMPGTTKVTEDIALQ